MSLNHKNNLYRLYGAKILRAVYKKIKKDKKSSQWLFLALLVGLLFFKSPNFFGKIWSYVTSTINYIEYKEFGIWIPKEYDVHGIDVSRWQSSVDWSRVKNMQVDDIKIDFVFMKSSQGTTMRDSKFKANWASAKKSGLIRGAYHYFEPKYSSKDQARNMFKALKLEKGDLPPVVDVEKEMGMSSEQIRLYTKEFLVYLERYYNVKPILYTYSHFYKKHFAGYPEFEEYPLWIAHYNVSEPEVSDGREWKFWQHSDEGHVHGINPNVDFNTFSGSLNDLKAMCMQ